MRAALARNVHNSANVGVSQHAGRQQPAKDCRSDQYEDFATHAYVRNETPGFGGSLKLARLPTGGVSIRANASVLESRKRWENSVVDSAVFWEPGVKSRERPS